MFKAVCVASMSFDGFFVAYMLPNDLGVSIPKSEPIVFSHLTQGGMSGTGDRPCHHEKIIVRPKTELVRPDGKTAVCGAGLSWFPTTVAAEGYPRYPSLFPGVNRVTGCDSSIKFGDSTWRKFVSIAANYKNNIYYFASIRLTMTTPGTYTKESPVQTSKSWVHPSVEFMFCYPVAAAFNSWKWEYKTVHMYPSWEQWDAATVDSLADLLVSLKDEAFSKVGDIDMTYDPSGVKYYSGASWVEFEISGGFLGHPDLESKVSEEARRLFPPLSYAKYWPDLAERAAENIQYTSVNNVAFLKELKDQLGEIQALLDLIRAPKDPKKWASFFLACQYGTRLTISEVITLCQDLRRYGDRLLSSKPGLQRCRSRMSFGRQNGSAEEVINLNYKISYLPAATQVEQVLSAIRGWGLLPTFSSMWDIVPYSFVVDWFVDIGGMLESIDFAMYMAELPVVGVTYTSKKVQTFSMTVHGAAVDVERTIYSRSTAPQVHLSHPELSFPAGFKQNILQLSAILVQKI